MLLKLVCVVFFLPTLYLKIRYIHLTHTSAIYQIPDCFSSAIAALFLLASFQGLFILASVILWGNGKQWCEGRYSKLWELKQTWIKHVWFQLLTHRSFSPVCWVQVCKTVAFWNLHTVAFLFCSLSFRLLSISPMWKDFHAVKDKNKQTCW